MSLRSCHGWLGCYRLVLSLLAFAPGYFQNTQTKTKADQEPVTVSLFPYPYPTKNKNKAKRPATNRFRRANGLWTDAIFQSMYRGIDYGSPARVRNRSGAEQTDQTNQTDRKGRKGRGEDGEGDRAQVKPNQKEKHGRKKPERKRKRKSEKRGKRKM